ncbi:MAG: hypothetical protein SFU98_16590 [Leptospiraceae bacterium]|nr:hypothetical protein [Leptospiraceae bacterium]
MKVILNLIFVILVLNCEKKPEQEKTLSLEKASSVSVEISWEYKNLPAKMQIFEPPAQRPYELWQTGTTKELKNAPVSIEIENSKFNISPGSKKSFVLVMQNITDKPIYFFAAPHLVHPAEHSLGFKFKCLCVNHAFTIAPQEYWFRVVELRVSENFLGSSMNIQHTLVGITEKHSKEFGMEKEN